MLGWPSLGFIMLDKPVRCSEIKTQEHTDRLTIWGSSVPQCVDAFLEKTWEYGKSKAYESREMRLLV